MFESAPPVQIRKRCMVYVDAFNWYFGVFIHRPAWKWLNLESFFETLRLDEEVVGVKIFSALVDPKLHVSPKRDRQKRYLEALKSLPKVQVIMGKYQQRTVTCQARDCIRKLEYTVPEEKKTDVNIAVHLIDAVLKNRADTLVIVSGDSDLEPAVEWIRHNHPKIKVNVYIPVLEQERQIRRNDNYHRIGVPCRDLPLTDIPRHLLPSSVTLPDGKTIQRPSEWV